MGRATAYLVAAMMGLGNCSDPGMYQVEPTPDPAHPCLLPGCDKPANRGGYCCADHCREHKAALRRERRGGAK